jgi:hypothetical protein
MMEFDLVVRNGVIVSFALASFLIRFTDSDQLLIDALDQFNGPHRWTGHRH